MKIVRVTTVPSSLSILLKGQLLFMKKNGFDIVAVSAGGKEVNDVIEREGCRHITVPMTRIISPFIDLVCLIRMYKVLKQERPDIVHSHTPKAGMVAMMAAYLARVPKRLHTVAGLPLVEAKGIKRKILESVEKITYACANEVYVNSKNQAAFIIQSKFCSGTKIKVLGNGSSNGIDTDYYNLTSIIQSEGLQLKDKLQLKDEKFVFIFIGRLVRDKGIEELIAAFGRLEKRYSNVRLLLLGIAEPELDPLTEATRRLLENSKNILCVGFQKDIRPYLTISDALVFPTYREGFPNVPMQAGCFHLPSIVTDINGCNEIIEHEINGLIIPVKDDKAIYNSMERLLINKDLYAALKANARRMIVERYDQKYFWSLLAEEYSNHLKKYRHVPEIHQEVVRY